MLGIRTGGFGDIAGFAHQKSAADADIRGEFAFDLIAKAQVEVGVGDAGPEIPLGNILGRDADFGAGLKDQPLGDAKVVLGLQLNRRIGVFGDVQGGIEFDFEGGHALKCDHTGPAIFVVIGGPLVGVLYPDLKTPERRDRAGVEQIGFGLPFVGSLEDRFALVFPPEFVEVAADPAPGLPAQVPFCRTGKR